MEKSTVDEIRERFDNDVERFSNLETGQQTMLDSPVCLELIADAAKLTNPQAKSLLDIGCGAGNFTLKLLGKLPGMDCTLIDLSGNMLQRAAERVGEATTGKVERIQADIREYEAKENQFDIVVAASVLHHLREDEEWEQVFAGIYRWLKPGGSFWIFDLVTHDSPSIEELFRQHFGRYLESLGGENYREKVFAYIAREDSPRSILYQTDLMKKTGFTNIELLHKNLCSAAFGGMK